jgi:segregation and condensation protein B
MRLVLDPQSPNTAVNPDLPSDGREAESPALPVKEARKNKNRGAEERLPRCGESEESVEVIDGPVQDAEDDVSTSETDSPVDTATLEALLFSTHHPLTTAKLAELMQLPKHGMLRKAIKSLNAVYEDSKRSFRIEQVAGGYQMLTLPEHGEALKRLHQKEIDSKLTKSAVETLAIIAYKQPILRADVEAIRGVACGETIRSLMEKHLVRIGGRAELPGRPILYGTTKRFLELFGLNTLKDLPQAQELQPPRG